MKKIDSKTLLKAILPLLAALLSIFVITKYAASPEVHQKTIDALDQKKTTVLELTAASTAASAAITLLPDDTATPIAEKLTDLSACFLIVVCAIYIEKYLVTITGYATFLILIPLACAVLSVNAFLKKQVWQNLAYKLIAFGIAIFMIIPTSVKIADLIEATYQASIQSTIDSALETADLIEQENSEEDAEEAEESSGKKEGFFAGIISQVTESVTTVTDKVKTSLNDFIEALAIMLVTSCVIPILVILFFWWVIKLLLSSNVSEPR